MFWQNENGGLGCGLNSKNGGLRCGSGQTMGSLLLNIPILDIYARKVKVGQNFIIFL